jgi:SAM-dependent methyltransferase
MTTMASMDAETFARLFSAQYAEFVQDLPLWRRLAREAGGLILEIGCGAGRVLRVLAGDGFDVTGIDTNPEMLRRARERLSAGSQPRARLVEQDVRSLDLPDRYRLILAPCNTLAGLSERDLAQALTRIRQHLQNGGSLAFEVPSPWLTEGTTDSDEPLAAFLEPESGNPVQVYAEQRADLEGKRVEVTWRYDELRPDGTVRAWLLPTTFYLRRPGEYAEMLENAGFPRVAFYGSYDLGPLGPGSLQFVVVAARV